MSSGESTEISPGTSGIYFWLLNHGSENGCTASQVNVDFLSINFTILLVCPICGQKMIAAMGFLGAITEMLAEISRLPGVSLQLRFGTDGHETGSEKLEES